MRTSVHSFPFSRPAASLIPRPTLRNTGWLGGFRVEGGRVGKEEGGGSRTTLYKSSRHLARYTTCQKLTRPLILFRSRPRTMHVGVAYNGKKRKKKEIHFILTNLSYCNFSASLAKRVYMFPRSEGKRERSVN